MVEQPDAPIAVARQVGASAARFIIPEKLVFDQKFAAYCHKPRYPNYGFSPISRKVATV